MQIDISEKIFNFIDRVPMDEDMPEIRVAYGNNVEISDESYLFNMEDAKSLATSRRFGKI